MSRNYRSIAEPKTLNGNVSNVATQITLNNVTGLPSPPYVLVINPDTANEEAVLVTTNQDGVTAPTLKVERAIETGATAKTHTDTNAVRHMIVGSDLQLAHDHIDATAEHGATGAVVGTTNTQTLTNKTLTTPKINENVTLTATSTELNVLDGITASTAELNIMDGVTSSAAELNILDGATLSTTELNYVDGVTSAIQTQFSTVNTNATNNTPVGVVNMWITGTAPTGWLLCDGSTKSTTTNPELANLYSVIGTTYGGTGATSFKLPDLRGRIPMGAGTGRNVADSANLTGRTLGAKVSDDENITLTSGQSGLPAHSHANTVSGTFASSSHAHIVYTDGTMSYHVGNGVYYTEGNTIPDVGAVNTLPPSGGGTASVSITNVNNTAANAAEAHNNIQPSTVINFIIKT